jgi:hypothetical protein
MQAEGRAADEPSRDHVIMIIEPNVPLRPHEDCPRMAGRPALSTTDGHASSDTEYVELDVD